VSAPAFPRAGVAGWPIAHSRSPLIHGYWLKTLGISGAYEKFAVPPDGFAAFAQTIRNGELVGANVTVPHKESAFAACDWLSANAAGLGAVNTLWREDDKLCGDNTDVAGFLANLDDKAPGWPAQVHRAIVIGAGGAARAVVAGLRSRGAEAITLVNRTHERALRLAQQSGGGVEAAPFEALTALLAGADLLVNASSLGMQGQPALAIDLRPAPTHAIVTDLVYVPLRTSLIAAAADRGLRIVDGLGMLLHQAVPGFERWFGVRPHVTPVLRALVEADILGANKGPIR
jgi:shikimate dehydrogenase